MNLSQQNLQHIANDQHIVVPSYDRVNTEIGIVHLGPGAFHRAHQAVYTEKAMNLKGGDWGICGVSLRSAKARDVLAKQDNLYTLAVVDTHQHYQVIGAIKEVLVASEQSSLVMERLSAETTKLVTLTITEKGYCLGSDGSLDLSHPDIVHDLSNRSQPISAIGFIAQALAQRKMNNIAPFNVLSCDNVSDNGDKLRRAVIDYAYQLDVDLAAWIEVHVAFPNSMVDSITPKTESYTVDGVSNIIGLRDEWPIQREEFTQWVIEDNWQGCRPAWDQVGVIFTSDVAGFEKAKLRLLNCLHSTLAYAGSLAGFETVFEATSDENFFKFISDLASDEVIGSFVPPKELDVEQYGKDIIQRFLNPEIRHLLSQIAWDGSQKLQMRILPIIRDNLALNRSTKLLSLSLACWFEFICKAVKDQQEIVDPLADEFYQLKPLKSDNSTEIVEAFLNIESIFGTDLKSNTTIKTQLIDSLIALRKLNPNNINGVMEQVC